MLEEHFTYQNVEKELFYKHTKNCCYSTHVTMVTVTSNSEVEVSKKKCFEKMANGLLAVNISNVIVMVLVCLFFVFLACATCVCYNNIAFN